MCWEGVSKIRQGRRLVVARNEVKKRIGFGRAWERNGNTVYVKRWKIKARECSNTWEKNGRSF